MPIPKDIVEKQIHHLLLKEDDRQALVEELQEMNQDELEELAHMIREHDKALMPLLEERAQKMAEIKDQALKDMGESDDATEEELEETRQAFESIFSDQESMSEFLNNADDLLIQKVSELFAQLLQNDPERQQAVKNFFREIRLQKHAFEKDLEQGEKQILVEAIEEKKKDIAELDALIAEAEQLLESDGEEQDKE